MSGDVVMRRRKKKGNNKSGKIENGPGRLRRRKGNARRNCALQRKKLSSVKGTSGLSLFITFTQK